MVGAWRRVYGEDTTGKHRLEDSNTSAIASSATLFSISGVVTFASLVAFVVLSSTLNSPISRSRLITYAPPFPNHFLLTLL